MVVLEIWVILSRTSFLTLFVTLLRNRKNFSRLFTSYNCACGFIGKSAVIKHHCCQMIHNHSMLQVSISLVVTLHLRPCIQLITRAWSHANTRSTEKRCCAYTEQTLILSDITTKLLVTWSIQNNENQFFVELNNHSGLTPRQLNM